MNKHLRTISLFLAVCALFFTSCDNEKQVSYMPTWRGFTYSPKPVHPGDSVTIVAQQAELGHLIYKAVYTWTATYHILTVEEKDSLVTFTHEDKVVYDYEPADPSLKLYIPTNLNVPTVEVSFKGEYHYSAQGVTGTDGSTITGGYTGSLHQSQSSQLIGYSTGSLRLYVNE